MSEKLRMGSAGGTEEKIAKLRELFPGVVTETVKGGKPALAVDFEALRLELGDAAEEGERYRFTWPDKQRSVLLADAPVRAALRPEPSRSVNFADTENLYIEGDNLAALKLLREAYLGKIKMIYIDPPYNTGNDFVYEDDFMRRKGDYLSGDSGQYDAQGNLLLRNPESNGRFHTDWLNMMYPRLKVARDLLADNGVIFISIDDNEADNLKKICEEIFGRSNFIAQCVRKRRDSQANLSKNISPIHEYLLIYAKNGALAALNKIPARVDESEYKNPDGDPRGPYVTMPCTNKGGSVYSVVSPTGKTITDEWRFKEETYRALEKDNRIVFPRGGNGKPRYKLFLSEKRAEGVLANTWLDDVSSNQDATREIKELFGAPVFDMPKPVGLLKFCCELATDKDSVVLDFFSGSATTAHAVMQLNAEDGGRRKFIMVQLPEPCGEQTEAYRAGFGTICMIGEERIRRAGRKIAAQAGSAKTDVGFRVLRLDSSNMKEIYYRPEAYEQEQLDLFTENVKEDRTPLDLLFQAMPELNVPLSAKIEERTVGGTTFYIVGGNEAIACFDRELTDDALIAIAKMKPAYAVFRDGSFASDSVAANFEQIFARYSPNTVRKVI